MTSRQGRSRKRKQSTIKPYLSLKFKMADWKVGFTAHCEGLSFLHTALRVTLGRKALRPPRQRLPVLPGRWRVARRSLRSWQCVGEGPCFSPRAGSLVGCCFSAGPGDFPPAAAASGERGAATAQGMRGSRPWQGKCTQILLPQDWGLRTSLGWC